MKIVTLTLSPAFDLHCTAATFEARHENLISVTSRCAGGKGVNISRALSAVGAQNVALAVLGKDNQDEFEKLLQKENVPLLTLPIDGRIRENITVHCDDGTETRISYKGPDCDDTLMDRVEEKLGDLLLTGDVLTCTGRLPEGVTVARAAAMLNGFSAKGVKVVIDSRSFGLADMVQCKPFLIKPNEEEISAYLGKPVTDFSQALPEAKRLNEQGIENVCISFGGKGAIFVCADGAFTAKAPSTTVVSTVGAGDSFIAGFLSAYQNGQSPEECFATAMAFGGAACMTEGTTPPAPEQIEALKTRIVVNT